MSLLSWLLKDARKSVKHTILVIDVTPAEVLSRSATDVYVRKFNLLELGYMCPRGLTGPPAMTLTK